MAEKKKNLGGRPKGAKDKKPRKRVSKKGSNPWEKKTKTRRSTTNKRLLLDQLSKYNFDVVQEVLWLYDQLKGQMQILEVKDDEGEKLEIKIYPEKVTQQMLEILKMLVGHSFPKMKALELTTSHDNPITLSFNIGADAPKPVEGKVVKELPEAIDMISGPGGIHLPVPKKD